MPRIPKKLAPLSQRLRGDPTAGMIGLSAETISSMASIMEELAPAAQLRRVGRWITGTAAHAPDNEAAQGALREFEACVGLMDSLTDRQMLAVTGALEAAFTIAALAPPGEDVMHELRKKGTERGRDAHTEKARAREKQISDGLQAIEKEHGFELSAGEKFIASHWIRGIFRHGPRLAGSSIRSRKAWIRSSRSWATGARSRRLARCAREAE